MEQYTSQSCARDGRHKATDPDISKVKVVSDASWQHEHGADDSVTAIALQRSLETGCMSPCHDCVSICFGLDGQVQGNRGMHVSFQRGVRWHHLHVQMSRAILHMLLRVQ